MKILLLGSGGREHALFSSLQQEENVEILITPGNAGIPRAKLAKKIDIEDPNEVVRLAQDLQADLVVVGPELPLVAGLGNALRKASIPCFGPDCEAARIESSKKFAKDIMESASVPTAASVLVTKANELDQVLKSFPPPYVVKDDGLAAGKGVLVTSDLSAAQKHALQILKNGGQVLLEEYLEGPEVSLFSLVAGDTVVPLIPAQDHKRLLDGDEGPNTGGMGAYAPLKWLPENFVTNTVKTIVKPVVKELSLRGTPFVGLLYAGLILAKDTSANGFTTKVIEFNCRFGDPETQAILPLLGSKLSDLLYQTATSTLKPDIELHWKELSSITVVLAAAGYPDNVRKNIPITNIPEGGVLHAGTKKLPDGTLVNSGGRVLNIGGIGKDFESARSEAYGKLAQIKFENGLYRKDIGNQAGCSTIEKNKIHYSR